jgi:hypothetical protein
MSTSAVADSQHIEYKTETQLGVRDLGSGVGLEIGIGL